MWRNRYRDDIGNDCLVSVDVTDFQVLNYLPFCKRWFSHKFRGPGVRYEVALNIRTGDIVWIYGPSPCGSHSDLVIFREAMKTELDKGEHVEADDGYRGEPGCVNWAKGPFIYTKFQTRMKQRLRSRQETVNRRFKQFNALKHVFRHKVTKHSSVFRAVAVITQVNIESGNKLFEVEYTWKNKHYPD